MYRINRLNRNVLITPDEVIFHSPSMQEVDERQIINSIIVAEERFIASAICDRFYEELIEQKNKVVTKVNQSELINQINESLSLIGLQHINEDDLPVGTIVNSINFIENKSYVELWNRFLWKITAECVDYIATVPSWLRHTSQGQMLNSPKTIAGASTDSASGDIKEVSFKLDNMIQDRINPLLERMELWICQRKEHYPLFCKPCMGCNNNGIDNAKKSNFITGIYED